MGSQQILSIVIGIFIVSVSIVASVQIYDHYIQEKNRELVIAMLYDIGKFAVEYHKKPTEFGGGGGKYSGFEMPPVFAKTDVGKFKVKVRSNRVNIIGRGTEIGRNGRSVIRIILRIEPDETKLIDRN